MTEQEAIDIINDSSILTDELEDYREIHEARRMAMDALYKQMPKKPIDDKAFGICPCCHTEFNSELVQEYNVKFCLNCGQAIDWSDT